MVVKRNYSLIAKQFASYALKIVNPAKGTDLGNTLLLDMGMPIAFAMSALFVCCGLPSLAATVAVLGGGFTAVGVSYRLGENGREFDREVAQQYGASLNTAKYEDEFNGAVWTILFDVIGPAALALAPEKPFINKAFVLVAGAVVTGVGALLTYTIVQSVRNKLAGGPGLLEPKGPG